MGGSAIPGPAPKNPAQRARRNKDTFTATARLPFERFDPPPLPKEYEWHPMTVRWWDAWARSSLNSIMSEVDWQEMLTTARLHSDFWAGTGHWTIAAELRQRVAKFGATPEDRLKLRIQWADADKSDAEVPQTAPVPTREKYADLHVLPMPGAGSEDTG